MGRYKLRGLNCATCASKIEEDLKKKGIDARVSFSTSELITDASLDEVLPLLQKVDPGIDVDSPGNVRNLAPTVLSGILLLILLLFGDLLHSMHPLLEYAIFIVAYLSAGYRTLLKAFSNLWNLRNPFEENFLITIATLGAIAIHELPEAVAVMLFFRVGEMLQDAVVERSRKSIKALLQIKPEYASVKRPEGVVKIRPEEVEVGDVIIIKPGEKIPLDGTVVQGKSDVDPSAITGESRPVSVAEGDEVFSGMVNISGLLTVRVTRVFSDSTVSRILRLVEEAESRKARTEKFITRFSRYYTPAVIATALLIAVVPPLLYGAHIHEWVYRALVLLVIACPCALVLSVPLEYFAAIGRAAKRGVLIKGASYVDVLSTIKTVAIDKTGTLTEGRFKVEKVVAEGGFDGNDVLRFAAMAEMNSNHPIAKAITEEAAVGTGVSVGYREMAGKGVVAEIDGHTILVGNDALMHEHGVEHGICDIGGSGVHVAVDGVYAGYILLADRVREGAKNAVDRLSKLGCRVVMLTGDNRQVAEQVAKKLGIDSFYAELLPQDKVRLVEEMGRNGKIAFAGDGINDAPVIARADVGIAMGGLGSDAAIEVADVVITDDNPEKIPEAISIARKTRKIVWENIVFALSVKGFFITLGAIGLATMWEAVFADVGVTLLALLNSMRIFK